MKQIHKIILIAVFVLAMVGSVPALQPAASAEASYYIEVDITNQYVTVYRKSDMEVVRQMICSTGKSSTPTPTGTFTMPAKSRSSERTKWYTFSDCYAQYASRIRGGYLFHSYLFSAKRNSAVINSSVNALGSQASHGCIRLRIADAKWIAKNCFQGTKVKIYRSGRYNSAIRSLLFKESFSINGGQSYDEWASIADNGELGRGNTGAKVKQVQQRLVGLGFADMASDGVYGQLTVDAVKSFQKAASLSGTGVVDGETWDALFADDAPAGTLTPSLYGGTTGAKVALLQETLKALRLYDGSIDGSFGAATIDAVNYYKRVHGQSENGKMDSSAFKAAIAEAAELAERFGNQEFELRKTSVQVSMAKVKVKSYTYLRKSKSFGSKALKKLKKKARVVVISKKKSWTKVRFGSKVGYVATRYLKFYTATEDTWEYALVTDPTSPPGMEVAVAEPIPEATAEPTPEPTVEPTPEPTVEPTPEPTAEPTSEPTAEPTLEPTAEPTPEPTAEPTPEPTAEPTPEPTAEPTSAPTTSESQTDEGTAVTPAPTDATTASDAA